MITTRPQSALAGTVGEKKSLSGKVAGGQKMIKSLSGKVAGGQNQSNPEGNQHLFYPLSPSATPWFEQLSLVADWPLK